MASDDTVIIHMENEVMVRAINKLPFADLIIIQADRRNIEEADIRPTRESLNLLLEAGNTCDCFERVEFCISGYDNDPRELCEIHEVREWMTALDKAFPYWFLFLNKTSLSLGFVTFALCPYNKTPEGRLFLDPADMMNFMLSHFAAVNELAERGFLTDSENRIISEHVADYYSRQIQPAD